jgi:hypothetical protein
VNGHIVGGMHAAQRDLLSELAGTALHRQWPLVADREERMRHDAAGPQGVQVRGIGVAEPGRIGHGPARVDVGLDLADRGAHQAARELQGISFH